eukprot:545668_1
MCAMWYSYQYLSCMFHSPSAIIADVIIPLTIINSSISLHSLLPGFTRTITIFMFKQAINAYCRKGKCVSIRYSPYIRWNNGKNAETKSTKAPTVLMDIVQGNDHVKTMKYNVEMGSIQTMVVEMEGNDELQQQ